MKYIIEDEFRANVLLNLVKHHKKHCKEPNCGVSLSAMRSVYEALIGRECTNEESGYFF